MTPTPVSFWSPLGWAIAVSAVLLTAVICAPHAEEYPLAAVSVQTFVLMHLLLPACRFYRPALLSPGNFAQFFFAVQLVVVPLLFVYFGPYQGTLPFLPTEEWIEWAMAVRIVAYVSFCLVWQSCSPAAPPPVQTGASRPFAGGWLILPCAVLGVLGFFLTHGSITSYLEFLTSPVLHRAMEAEPATPVSAAGTFLKPFVGFSIVLAWSWWLARGGSQRDGILVGVVTLLVMLLLPITNFTYNRGTLLVPVVAVAAAYSSHVRRLSLPAISLAGALVLAAAFLFGWYRSTSLEVTEVSGDDLADVWKDDELIGFVQVYASGPQMVGYLLQDVDADGTRYYGRTLFPSLVYPIPVLGKPFRDASGVTILNDRIYHDPEIADQIISYDGELYMNLHLPGVICGYALLGWVAAFVQRRFLTASTAVESYLWFTLGVWIIFPGSLPVTSQMFVFFFWPIYGYLLFKFVFGRQTEKAVGTT
jgi:hypothetical protein